LAQRNLAWGDLANPGVDGSRRALNTFRDSADAAGRFRSTKLLMN
jgi:hypothetical protein